METLLLDVSEWDLVLDINGDIALASNPYAIAQDVASAVKLFKGELWYDSLKGVPYFSRILGDRPPVSLIKAELVKASLTVPETVSARVVDLGMKDRQLAGNIEVIDQTGQTNGVTF